MRLLELFNSTFPFNHDVWRFDRERSWLEFYDSDGKTVSVFLKRIDNEGVYYSLDFARDGNGFEVTGDGRDVSKIFATVVEAGRIMINELRKKGVEVNNLIIAALSNQPSRVSLYKRLVQRFALQNGYELVKTEHGRIFNSFVLKRQAK